MRKKTPSLPSIKNPPDAAKIKRPISQQDRVLLYHTVLIGAANFIPVPFVDDFLVQKLRQRMVKELARVIGGFVLSPAEAQALLNDRALGCGSGCLVLIGYAVKEIVREFVFLLDIRRGINLVAETYCRGYLLIDVFASGWYVPSYALNYGAVISKVISETNLKLVQNAFSASFSAGKHLLRSISGWLWGNFKYYLKRVFGGLLVKTRRFFRKVFHRRQPVETPAEAPSPDLEQMLVESKPELAPQIDALVAQLQANLGMVPGGYFETMKERLRKELVSQRVWEGK